MLQVSYSTFNDNAIGVYISREYNIGELICCNFISRGMNDTYVIETTIGKYVFRVYRSNWRSKYSEILFEIDLLNHLSRTSLNVSLPIKSIHDNYVQKLIAPEGNRFGVLFTLVEGVPLQLDNIEICYLFGEEAAKLHLYSNSFQSSYEKANIDIEFLIDAPLDILKKHLSKRQSELHYFMNIGSYLRDRIMELRNIDWGICHGDLHGYNAHIQGKRIANFDFDLCGFGWRAYDLAVFKFTLDLSDSNKDKKAQQWAAFLEGYQKTRKLNRNDIEAIPIFIGVRRLWLMSLSLEYFRDLDITGSINAEENYIRDELLGFDVILQNLK